MSEIKKVEKMIEQIGKEQISKYVEQANSVEGLDLKQVINEIDLVQIIKSYLVESEYYMDDAVVKEVVATIDFEEIVRNIIEKEDFENFTSDVVGDVFESLSVDEMMALQGAGDIEGELTPATISSVPCLTALGGAVSGAASVVATLVRR